MNRRSAVSWGLRLVLTAGLLLLLFARVSLRGSLEALTRLAPGPVLVAALLVAIDRMVMALKWHVLVRPLLPGYRLAATLRVFFVGNLLGLFLPVGLGTDVLRAVGAWRDTGQAAESISSVAMERLVGFVGLVAFAMAALVLSPVGPAGVSVLVPAGILGLAVVLCVGLVLDRRLPEKLGAGIERLGFTRAARTLVKFVGAFSIYRTHRGALAVAFLLGLTAQWLRVLITQWLGIALGAQVSPAAYYAFVPLVTALSLVPVTIGGFGLREGGFVVLFAQVGLGEETAVALSFLTFVASVFGALPGAVFLARRGLARHAPRAD